MQVSDVMTYHGETLKFHQCLTLEEARENGLPAGIHFFWTLGKLKITSPAEILSMTRQAFNEGQADVLQLLDPRKLRNHYQSVHDAQKKSLKAALSKTKDFYTQAYAQAGMAGVAIAELKKNIDNREKSIDSMCFPSIDGLARPSREQAQNLVGGKDILDKFLPPEIQDEIFD